MVLLTHLTHWFYTNVWGNLVASGICTGIAYLKLRALHKKNHQQMQAHMTQEFSELAKTVNAQQDNS